MSLKASSPMRRPDLTIMLSPPAPLHADRIEEAGYRLISFFSNSTANVTTLRNIEADAAPDPAFRLSLDIHYALCL
jgi:hypothetical protein